jgi:hypothetical protein
MATYLRDGTWRQVNGIYVYINSWRTVNSAWVFDGSVWKQVHSTGTFQPEIRDAGGTALSYRNVGISMVGYRGYTNSATATYQWQYSIDGGTTWSNQTGTNNSGSYAAATLTTSYTTDTTDVNSMESLFLNNGIYFYMRLRVTRSGETQFSQNVRVGKRIPINASSTLSLLRNSSGLTYTLTGASNERNPYPNDQVFWTPNFTSTTNITNDTRPDYYIFTFQTNSGVTERDSRTLDVANPRNPLNARRYTVQTSDIGGPIVCDMNAWNSNENAPRTVTIITRPVTTNVLVAPINLVSSYNNGAIVGTWDAASGGNDGTINYVAYLFQNGSLIYTSPSSTLTTFSYTVASGGDFRFYVVASQAGNASVTSEYSNTTSVVAPTPFSASIADVTSQYPPGDFSINAPVLSANVLNRWDWTWTASTNATVYESVLTRPSGTTAGPTTTSATTDYWGITSTGTHRETVTAINRTTNYVRISWTKPFGTSALSYRVNYQKYIGVNGTNNSVDVGDVTFLDVEVPYSSDPTFSTGNSIVLNSVTAYSGPNQTGVPRLATSPAFPNNYSIADKTSSRTVFREDFLSLENPQTGFIYITGTFEPGFTLTMTGTRPSTGTSNWSPDFSAPGWSHVYRWYRSGTVNFTQISGANQVNFTIPSSSTYIGDEVDASVVSTYKGQAFSERFDSTSVSLVTPNPPTFSLIDNGNRTFNISSVSSVGATSYYGSYSGTASGTVGETLISSAFTSPQVPAGSISATLNARRYVNYVFPSTQNGVQINSLRSTTNNLSVAVSPQDTGSRRYLNNVYIINPGTFFYISTNGYLGLQSTTSGSSIGIPNDGSWLNMAQADYRQESLYTLATADGWWVRWRGTRLNNPSLVLEYQVYYQYNTGVCYVNFVQNTVQDYLANLAWKSFGGTQSTWLGNSSVDSGANTQLISVGSMVRNTSNDGVDDGVTLIQVIAPAIPMTSNPTVTRVAGGFEFNITNQSTGTFESAATYGGLIFSGTATFVINATTGLVTVSGMSSSAFASIRISKARSGYGSTIIEVTGQALAGLPAVQVTKPTLTGSSGSYSTTKADVGAVINAGTGSYNNQSSKTTYIITALSNTGFNQALSSYSSLGASVTISTSSALSSANLYKTVDRVVGTDASITFFASDDQIQAAYPPPTITNANTTLSDRVTLTFTAYPGASSVYAYKDGVLQTSAATSPYVFPGLSASTAYSLTLKSANADGVTSAGSAGGSYTTASAATRLATPTGVSASRNRSDGIRISWNAVANAASYGVWYRGGAPGIDSAPDFPTTTSLFLDDTGIAVGTERQYDVQAYPAAGSTTLLKSQWGGPSNLGIRTSVPVTPAPVLSSISGNNSLALGGTFTWSYTNSPTAYSIFCQGPTGSVFTTGNAYTYFSTSFRPGYDGSGWQGAGNYTLYVSARNAGGDSVVSSQTTFMN